MKKLICIALALGLILSLAACAGGSAFDPDAPTEAQSFAMVAMKSCPVKTGYELKRAEVLLTEDFKKSMETSVGLEKWDLSGVSAAVVLSLGAVDEDTVCDRAFFLMAADNSIVFSCVTGVATGAKEPEAPEPVDYAALTTQLLAEHPEEDFSASALRRRLARLELDEEAFIAALDAAQAELVTAAQAEIEKNPDAIYDTDYLISLTENTSLADFDKFERERLYLTDRVAELSACEELSDKERYAAYERLVDKYFFVDCRLAVCQQLASAQAELKKCELSNAKTLSPLKAEVKTLADKDPDYLYSEAYLALCAGSEALDTCDRCQRKITLCEAALELLKALSGSEDLENSEYLIERAAESAMGLSSYVDSLKAAEKSQLAYDSFIAENRAQLDDCDSQTEALRKQFGDDLSENLDYIKLQMKYSTLLDERNNLQMRAGDARALADANEENYQASLESLEKREQGRRDSLEVSDEQAALTEYLCGDKLSSAKEPEAQPGQWCALGEGYLLWQNQNLVRPVTHAGGSDKGDKTEDYDKSGDYYSAHDTDGDGKMSRSELRAALREYINSLNNMYN